MLHNQAMRSIKQAKSSYLTKLVEKLRMLDDYVKLALFYTLLDVDKLNFIVECPIDLRKYI